VDNLARVGPTTPTRAGRLSDASVDPTDARNDILGCVGRSVQRGLPNAQASSRDSLQKSLGSESQKGVAAELQPLVSLHFEDSISAES
jgi:hypothetical protein